MGAHIFVLCFIAVVNKPVFCAFLAFLIFLRAFVIVFISFLHVFKKIKQFRFYLPIILNLAANNGAILHNAY